MKCLCADSTLPGTYEQLLGERRADALVTDPPYCLLTRRRKGGDERDKKHKKIDRGPVRRFEDVRAYRDFTRSWMTPACARLVADAPLVIWTNLLGKQPITEVAKELGWTFFLGEFVWGKKTREGNSGEELLRVVEVALVFSRSAPAGVSPQSPALPWAVVAGYDDDGEGAKWGSHPNHKPFGVIEPLLRSWTRPGALVLEPFSGSGSIPAAAVKLGRQIACAELEPEWAERVTQRLNA